MGATKHWPILAFFGTLVMFRPLLPSLLSADDLLWATTLTMTASHRHKDSITCKWVHINSTIRNKDCHDLLTSLICSSEQNNNNHQAPPGGRRVLLFGDSTMGMLLKNLEDYLLYQGLSQISQTCSNRYSCKNVTGERCRNNNLFGLDLPINNTWNPPDINNYAEGPANYGLKHPHCSDCQCTPNLIWCNLHNETHKCQQQQQDTNGDKRIIPVHGGYIPVQFARDVVLQTPEFGTTQENVALFLNRTYNRPELVQDFGRPICVVSAGHHDAAIPGITKEKFLTNVGWYLNMLDLQCESFIWIATTATKTDEFAQKRNLTEIWNDGVLGLLEQSPILRGKVVFVDGFEASTRCPHQDNVHMSKEWYQRLASLIQNVATAPC